ncbi:hypothetical protein QJ857_gp0254 [Tupanvirus soda lake]|uniref:Endonuclease/exonuclease/phosphatase domain-containing protein n=2 Tax=Tupanvirus TaxID=2094720 RepID=A0A6N1P4A1_9VIRU|nr:hypothetical protein QJ857_gp0254 [Tupanvirus soda lake]QKU35771.1 hypothetical protein [Tupanvirus soda lake]
MKIFFNNEMLVVLIIKNKNSIIIIIIIIMPKSIHNNICTIASYLMDPLCETRNTSKEKIITEYQHPNASKIKKIMINRWLDIKTFGYATLAVLSTPIGLMYRSILFPVCNKPYLHYQTKKFHEIEFNESTITLLSWNICCPPAGYSITDGGVVPWPKRLKKIIEIIKFQSPDILCLYEVFDIQTV